MSFSELFTKLTFGAAFKLMIKLQLFLLFFLSHFLWSTSVVAAPPTAPVNVAALIPLSGPSSDQGEWCRRGIVLAEEKLNEANPSRLNVIYEDTRGDTKLSVQAFSSLHSRTPLFGMLTWGSGVGLALSPEANRNKVIQIGVATGAPSYRSLNDFNLRVFHSGDVEGKYIAKNLSVSASTERIAVLAVQNDYGVSLSTALKEELRKTRQNIVFDETFTPGSIDFRSELSKIKAASPTVLALVTYAVDGARVLKQLRELGLQIPVFSSGAILGGDMFFDVVGNAAEGVRLILPPVGEGAMAKEFAARYERKYKEPATVVNYYSAHAFDAILLLNQAVLHCGKADTSCAKDYLLQLRNFDGASGTLSFDANGDVEYPLAVFQFNGRRIVRHSN